MECINESFFSPPSEIKEEINKGLLIIPNCPIDYLQHKEMKTINQQLNHTFTFSFLTEGDYGNVLKAAFTAALRFWLRRLQPYIKMFLH
jgi:hypothetical protein